MAEVAPEDQDPFVCPICLDPLEDPVTIPCGHNYCMACIKDYWNEHERSETYSCPECRETFTPRPALNKNTMFAEMVERFKKVRLQDVSPANPGPVNMKCSICTAQKLHAVKFCPECDESCDAHRHRHTNTNFGENHIVVVSREPRMNICLHHNMPLEIYCRTDQQLICSLCLAESHRDHDAVSVAPVSTKIQVHKNSHGKTQHGNWHRSHEHSRRKHKQCGHSGGHGTEHRSRSRKSLHSKGSHEVGNHENHGHTMIRNGQVEGGGHVKGKHGSGRHGSWHRSSRHERSGH